MESFWVYLFAIITSSAAYHKENCETCVYKYDCPLFVSLTDDIKRQLWVEKVSCRPHGKNYHDIYVEQNDYICCSNNAWGVLNDDSRVTSGQFLNSNTHQINRNTYWNERPGRNQWSYGNNYTRRDELNNAQQASNNNWQRNNNFNKNRNRIGTPNYPNNNKKNPASSQCDRLTSLIPDPQSGCCGQEASDDDRITGFRAPYSNAPSNAYNHVKLRTEIDSNWSQNMNRLNRAADDVVVTIEKRISGGEATQLLKFPWTVLLLIVFNYGYQQASVNCGGSLINSQFILSAAHCIYDKKGVRESIQVTLSEYDKTTFPLDCKGSECIENKVMYARSAIIHPQFNSDMLLNDISLIKLNGSVRFSDHIRPICLPTINIDKPSFDNLQFEVAGWGQNGEVPSYVKRSAIMHLVGRTECRRSYQRLTDKHLCAVGLKGEDTCKGDSGGPLMMLFRGRYYVMGVVSGKRADTQCGSVIVPSLYTNVFYYLDWIGNSMKNML